MSNKIEDPTHGFKGTRDEWAKHYMETYMIPGAKDYDNVHEESAMKRVLARLKKLETFVTEAQAEAISPKGIQSLGIFVKRGSEAHKLWQELHLKKYPENY